MRMKTVVFLGPTLSAAEALAIHPEIEVRPPAACGDIVRALHDEAKVIGLVDGYFDHQLSVWHKEVLWALSQGAFVYGAASMGALRASELHPFGMVGVGKVFEAYRSGSIEADDEVAVAHSAPEHDYVTFSEALVNVRATLDRAVQHSVIDRPVALQLLEVSRSFFYPQRTYRAIMNRALEYGMPPGAIDAFRGWLGPRESRKVDQKRADAQTLLEVLRAPLVRPEAPTFHFEYTEAWHEFLKAERAYQAKTQRKRPAARHLALGPGSAPEAARRTRREGVSDALWGKALERAFALALKESYPPLIDEASVQAVADRFRQEHGLLTPEDTQNWMHERGLDLEAFSAQMQDRAVMDALLERARELARRELPWVLTEDRELESSRVID